MADVVEPKVGSKHLQFVLEQLLGDSARPELRESLTPAHVGEIRLLVQALGRGFEAEGSSLEDQLLIASRLFAAANTLTAHYHALAQSAEDAIEQTEAKVAVMIREAANASSTKVTDKAVEAAVETHGDVVAAKARYVLCSELNDVAYGLRESVKMRFDALKQASDNRRVAMKVEG